MTTENDRSSRREFVSNVGRLASVAALTAYPAALSAMAPDEKQNAPGDFDLSWIQKLAGATDRAVFDWPTLGDASDQIVLQITQRYLDNCAAAYPAGSYKAIAVLNIRTTAIPAAMTDAAWARYSLGVEYNAKDPDTQEPAVRNPFWRGRPRPRRIR